MINDQVTTALIIGIIPALVFTLTVYFVNRSAARDATAALAAYDALPVPALPLFTADFDIVVEVGGVKYRVFFAVEDVQMVEGES